MWEIMHLWGGGMIMMMVLFPIVFFILLVVLVVKLITPKETKSYKESKKETDDNALQILKERFAKGEISDEEYKIKKDILKD